MSVVSAVDVSDLGAKPTSEEEDLLDCSTKKVKPNVVDCSEAIMDDQEQGGSMVAAEAAVQALAVTDHPMILEGNQNPVLHGSLSEIIAYKTRHQAERGRDPSCHALEGEGNSAIFHVIAFADYLRTNGASVVEPHSKPPNPVDLSGSQLNGGSVPASDDSTCLAESEEGLALRHV
ncbi:hypothetical protein RIF29_21031 [Crotalaria pallida]|uniref:Uncharacterized protein n=1 Tax=Crotalaria pallida TaxID=3830 RepID=A0AAN9F6L3_CROPI